MLLVCTPVWSCPSSDPHSLSYLLDKSQLFFLGAEISIMCASVAWVQLLGCDQGSQEPVCLSGPDPGETRGSWLLQGLQGPILATQEIVGLGVGYWRGHRSESATGGTHLHVYLCMRLGGPRLATEKAEYARMAAGVFVCVCRSEYQQLQWGCCFRASMSRCQQLGGLGSKRSYGEYAYM